MTMIAMQWQKLCTMHVMLTDNRLISTLTFVESNYCRLLIHKVLHQSIGGGFISIGGGFIPYTLYVEFYTSDRRMWFQESCYLIKICFTRAPWRPCYLGGTVQGLPLLVINGGFHPYKWPFFVSNWGYFTPLSLQVELFWVFSTILYSTGTSKYLVWGAQFVGYGFVNASPSQVVLPMIVCGTSVRIQQTHKWWCACQQTWGVDILKLGGGDLAIGVAPCNWLMN